MSYKHIPFDNTKYTKMGGVISKITGRNDLIYLRNRYQRELDNAWAALMNMAHHIEDSDDYNQTIIRTNAIAKYRGDVDDKKRENDNLYKDLYKSIINDQNFEERMWKIHQDMYKSGNSNQNVTWSKYNKNITVDSMKQYVGKYPTTYTTNTFEKIKELEQSLTRCRSDYRQNVSTLRDYFEHFKLDLMKLESKRKVYDEIKIEGETQLKACRFNGSVFHDMCSEETKQSMRVDTITHRIDQVDGMIAKFNNMLRETEERIKVSDDKYQVVLEPEFTFTSEF